MKVPSSASTIALAARCLSEEGRRVVEITSVVAWLGGRDLDAACAGTVARAFVDRGSNDLEAKYRSEDRTARRQRLWTAPLQPPPPKHPRSLRSSLRVHVDLQTRLPPFRSPLAPPLSLPSSFDDVVNAWALTATPSQYFGST